jgi:predicted GNAT family acetyltransferase
MNFTYDKNRIWLANETGEAIAFVDFPEFEPGKVEVTHTVVDPSLSGQGVAGKLMEALAGQLAGDGRKAELTCSYAIRWFAKHPEHRDLLIDPEAEAEKAASLMGDACGIPRHKVK